MTSYLIDSDTTLTPRTILAEDPFRTYTTEPNGTPSVNKSVTQIIRLGHKIIINLSKYLNGKIQS